MFRSLAKKAHASVHRSVEERLEHMTQRPVKVLIMGLALPTILSNLVSVLYNLGATFFIGKISTAASAAIGVAFATMTLIQGVGFFFGQGSGNAISRLLGKGERETAQTVASTGFISSLIAGLIIAVLGHIFLEPLCRIGGSTDTILPYAKAYIGYILIAAPFMAGSIVLNNQLRFEGNALFSMVGLISGAVLNLFLTPLFIFNFHMGIAGAGLATAICQFLSFCLLFWGIEMNKVAPIRLSSFHFTRELNKTMVNGGLPSLMRQIVLGFATVLLNSAARLYGDAAIAAIAIVYRVISVGNVIQIGIGQGFQPVCGFNYGAGHYNRVREGYYFSMILGFCILASISLVEFTFAPELIQLFRNDPAVIAIGVFALRCQLVSIPFSSVPMMTNFLLQTTAKMWRATLLGVARLGIILAPVVIILTHFFGLLGVQIAQSVSDTLALLIAIPLAILALRELSRFEKAQAEARKEAGAAAQA